MWAFSRDLQKFCDIFTLRRIEVTDGLRALSECCNFVGLVGIAVKQSDAEKLAALWTAAQTDVLAFLRAVIADADHVQDVLQQVAVALVRNFDRFDEARSFTAFAIGVAKKNEVLAYRRKMATSRLIFDDALVERAADAFIRITADRQPANFALEHCLKQVSGRGRQALDLYYGEGVKTAVVAQQIELSHGALRMLLSRVRESLRQCIESRMATQGGAS